jgi:hypothetical protein
VTVGPALHTSGVGVAAAAAPARASENARTAAQIVDFICIPGLSPPQTDTLDDVEARGSAQGHIILLTQRNIDGGSLRGASDAFA